MSTESSCFPTAPSSTPTTGDWEMLPTPPTSAGLDGYPLNVGNRTFVGRHLIRPATRKWTTIPKPPWDEQQSRTVLTISTMVFVGGGASFTDNLADGLPALALTGTNVVVRASDTATLGALPYTNGGDS